MSELKIKQTECPVAGFPKTSKKRMRLTRRVVTPRGNAEATGGRARRISITSKRSLGAMWTWLEPTVA